ncbi:hypothetical protein GGTG_13350 [Gaeumannomyces tritici R3-111a-1]|uniref:Uncharacterized protein n=1 Tax=Gaeumannomyces tritici (strain R3-111a-1) TaxID=644352 RepID=J3PIM1_GAET3|nr:hypothetical protein GGTG_13350 [Gaeumannomyces tritici R3-111a-1]EJT69082.1 hypothetical protein GGTG_13350 [Gaeumannomyces tritici R3-111a-1]
MASENSQPLSVAVTKPNNPYFNPNDGVLDPTKEFCLPFNPSQLRPAKHPRAPGGQGVKNYGATKKPRLAPDPKDDGTNDDIDEISSISSDGSESTVDANVSCLPPNS